MRGQSICLAPAGAEANNRLAFDLYAQLARSGHNLCFSPFSIASALTMLHAGAVGETARQIEAALHLPAGQALEPPRVQSLRAGTPAPTFLRIANALWAQDGYAIRPDYAHFLSVHHDAEIRSVDFEHDAEPVRRIINDWVSRKTRGKITNLISNPFDPLTRLVLTNAVHFVSQWSDPFDRDETRVEPFFVHADRTVDVQMMHRQDLMRSIQTERYRAAEIQYEDGPSMWVIVPEVNCSLSELEASLSAQSVADAQKNSRLATVNLSMPRFNVRSQVDLSEALIRLGMPDAFSDRADFGGIHEPTRYPLQLSRVVHEAFTDVNEERTEAGAATGVLWLAGGKSDPPTMELRLDRPFLFIIRDSSPGAILFMGRVVDPTRVDS